MNAKNAFFTVFCAFVSAFFFISCGGEGPDDPIDTDPVDDTVVVDDNEPTDEDLADNEPMDDVTDETPDDDGLNDNEPTDNDTAPLTCDQDPTCQEICKNFLDMAGNWNIVEPTTVSGTITVTLSVADRNCKMTVSGQWNFSWEGTEIPQMSCVQNEGGFSFFSLQEMEGEKLVIKKYESEESCKTTQGWTFKFEKVQ